MPSLKNHFETIKTDRQISPVSSKVYRLNIKKLSNELFQTKKFRVSFLRNKNAVIRYIDTLPSLSSRKTMLTSIIVLLKSIGITPTPYLKKLTEIAKEQHAFYIKNEKTSKEDINWITYTEIEDIIQGLEKEIQLIENNTSSLTERQQLDLYQKYLIIHLYTELPPLRNDYAMTRIINSLQAQGVVTDYNIVENYINLNDKTLVLQNYKTAKTYGTKVITIPQKLVNIIRRFEKFKKNYNVTHDFMLLNTTDLKPMSRNNLTKALNKIFYPKKISSTILRKVYLSNKYPIQHSMEEMTKDAQIMGHDIGTARKVYTKIL